MQFCETVITREFTDVVRHLESFWFVVGNGLLTDTSNEQPWSEFIGAVDELSSSFPTMASFLPTK